MKNFEITVNKVEFKNGANGYQVKIEGMEVHTDCHMNFYEPVKAMRYMFLLSKRLGLQINRIQLASLVIENQRVKEAKEEQQAGEAEQSAPNTEQQEKAIVPEEIERPESTEPIIDQYRKMKEKHPEAVLLFRCGDFYEAYDEDAQVCAEVLGITLTRRNGKEGLRMAGFPYHALDTYLPMIIRAGRRVAICDQIEAPQPKKRGRKTAEKKQESAE